MCYYCLVADLNTNVEVKPEVPSGDSRNITFTIQSQDGDFEGICNLVLFLLLENFSKIILYLFWKSCICLFNFGEGQFHSIKSTSRF